MATKPKTPRSTGTTPKRSASAKAAPKDSKDGAESHEGTGGDTAKVLRGRDLIDAVTVATGAKKTLVKEIVAATLTAMGDALAEGRALNLPPLGKAHVNRSKERGGAEVMVIKLRRSVKATATPEGTSSPAEALADPTD